MKQKKTRGQTFALVHLIELVLALIVFVFVAYGVLSMVNGVSFYEQIYARDNAHLIETFHAVPNGDVEFGYLWSSANYQLAISPDHVTVSKTTKPLVQLWKTSAEKKVLVVSNSEKYFGTGARTTVEPATFEPRYIRYTVRGNPERTIRASAQLAAHGCPAEPAIPGLIYARDAFTSEPIGSRVGTNALQNAGIATTSGPRIAFRYEAAPAPELLIIDKLGSSESVRAACLIEENSASVAVVPARGSLAAETPIVQNADADIIIVLRGRASDEGALTQALTAGISSLVGGAP
jgi:hypothetical protein